MQHINTIETKLKSIAIQYINTVKKVYESNILEWIKCTTSLIKHIDTIKTKQSINPYGGHWAQVGYW
jgi:hypothetical protein